MAESSLYEGLGGAFTIAAVIDHPVVFGWQL
jgi:hypothetical protein